MPVYFIRAGEDGPVKIGYARDPAQRIAFMQTANAARLIVIRLIEGGRVEEIEAHRAFQAHRLSGEWFKFSPEMLTHGAATALADPPRKPRFIFHPCVQKCIEEMQPSRQSIKHWHKRGVPYRVCCRAAGFDEKPDITLARYRSVEIAA